MDCSHSIRNIAEGYCRKSIREYLQFLNFALASSGVYYSCTYSFRKVNQLTQEEFEQLDKLQHKTENGLIQLIRSIEKKKKANGKIPSDEDDI